MKNLFVWCLFAFFLYGSGFSLSAASLRDFIEIKKDKGRITIRPTFGNDGNSNKPGETANGDKAQSGTTVANAGSQPGQSSGAEAVFQRALFLMQLDKAKYEQLSEIAKQVNRSPENIYQKNLDAFESEKLSLKIAAVRMANKFRYDYRELEKDGTEKKQRMDAIAVFGDSPELKRLQDGVSEIESKKRQMENLDRNTIRAGLPDAALPYSERNNAWILMADFNNETHGKWLSEAKAYRDSVIARAAKPGISASVIEKFKQLFEGIATVERNLAAGDSSEAQRVLNGLWKNMMD